MDDELKGRIQSLPVSDEDKEVLLKAFKDHQKKLDISDFKYKRTVADKTAMTNILNASIEEIKKQKKIIEDVRDEINRNLQERDRQKKLIEEQNSELSNLLLNLQKTQAQLILSEKMASLGELTAGIAHEIQNPLNFVNNFSDVSTELIAEMLAEIEKGEYEEAKAIANDVKQNLEKITHHGKRADGIVKGMLHHSRGSSGQKENIDINALADEYLRLAYHGLRAKEKSFNATLQTAYAENVGALNVVPQDIGRVLLNLITNAFHAVSEKSKQLPVGYQPTVSVITRREDDAVIITVKDNGTGIPPAIADKIFQPFFTTKPTGHGTGLGLSLAYEIINAHGGELVVESVEGEGTSFQVLLPLTSE